MLTIATHKKDMFFSFFLCQPTSTVEWVERGMVFMVHVTLRSSEKNHHEGFSDFCKSESVLPITPITLVRRDA